MEGQRLAIFILLVKEEDIAVIGAPVDAVVDAARVLEEFGREILDDFGKVIAIALFSPHCCRYYYHFFLLFMFL
jgi:hypothetical protein